ncbi:unnamed protein product [Paramecium sonneborni]|uniref:C2H2-type domain-containing protein n=1 Tax=Paramecium sonneborni TaxID=65129 RepID=A0A8S1Q8D8_9CILI|nr:unnamed protein product [Paramecium sonneborni]
MLSEKEQIEFLGKKPPACNKSTLEKLMMNFQQISRNIDDLDQDLNQLAKRLDYLEESITEHYTLVQPQKQEIKKKRRTANLIKRDFQCPYEKCDKIYGTDISLNLHIRLKHNGGSKIEREELAKKILEAKFQDEADPKHSFNLPPNFIEDFYIHHQEYINNLEKTYNKRILL